MSKKRKRWRVSDVFSAIERTSPDSKRTAGLVARWARMDAGRVLVDANIGAWLRSLPQAGRSIGIAWSDWMMMTDAQCVDAVVATARRLNVPMNG